MREEIEIMEETRTDYRAALSWLKATSVDPDKLGQIEKFRRVQAEVKSSKERFDTMKWAIQVKQTIKVCKKYIILRLKLICCACRELRYYQMRWGHFINTNLKLQNVLGNYLKTLLME